MSVESTDNRVAEAADIANTHALAELMIAEYVVESECDDDEADYIGRIGIRLIERLGEEVLRFAQADPESAAPCAKCSAWMLDEDLGSITGLTSGDVCDDCMAQIIADADEKYDPCDRLDTGIPKS